MNEVICLFAKIFKAPTLTSTFNDDFLYEDDDFYYTYDDFRYLDEPYYDDDDDLIIFE